MKFTKTIILTICVLALLSTTTIVFAAGYDRKDSDTLSAQDRLNLLVDQGYAFIGNLSQEEIINILGKPEHKSIKTHLNKHFPEYEDSYITLYYPRFIIQLFHSEAADQEFVTHFSIVEKDQDFIWATNIGMTIQQIQTIYGVPALYDTDYLLFEEETEAGSNVIFHLKNGIVNRIDFCFYTD